MNIPIRSTLAPALLLTGAALAGVQKPFDYEHIPVAPTAAVERIASSPTSLARAIELAEEALEGRVSRIEMDLDAEQPVLHLELHTAECSYLVRMDPASGEITSRETVFLFEMPGRAPVGEWVRLPSGVRYTDLVVGEGEPLEGLRAKGRIHFDGWLIDGKSFGSSRAGGGPLDISLDRVIAGWGKGLQGMRAGGLRKLIVPPIMGYGPNGTRNVPPNATLIFEIELVATRG